MQKIVQFELKTKVDNENAYTNSHLKIYFCTFCLNMKQVFYTVLTFIQYRKCMNRASSEWKNDGGKV